ncbi:MAG TPA: class I SAM-dependent methyltransferase [Sphingomonas sp.]|nr:class I SAM-dependent methyltransferase [Sphingomonas sp.]
MTAANDWTGRVGDVWAQEWRSTDRSFAALDTILHAAIVDAAPRHAFSALDIGCGAGGTSIALADARDDGVVVGVDLSVALVEAARQRAGVRDNLHFVVDDAVAYAAKAVPVDLIVSRHGVMFFADPVAAFAVLARRSRAGARLVFSCFAERAANPWSTILAPAPEASGYAPGPFAFADPDFVAATLAAAGWRDTKPQRVPFAYRVGAGADPIADATGFLSRIGPSASLLNAARPADRPVLLARLAGALAERRSGDAVDFPAAAWIWSATNT